MVDNRQIRDLEIRVRGHSRSLKMVPFDRLGMVSYQLIIEMTAVCSSVIEVHKPRLLLKTL